MCFNHLVLNVDNRFVFYTTCDEISVVHTLRHFDFGAVFGTAFFYTEQSMYYHIISNLKQKRQHK